mgnify:CR=1 FL=1
MQPSRLLQLHLALGGEEQQSPEDAHPVGVEIRGRHAALGCEQHTGGPLEALGNLRARIARDEGVSALWANDGDDEPSYLYYGETAKTVHLQGELPAGIERVRVYGSKDVTALTGVAAASKKGKRARRRDRQREVDARAPNVEAEQEEALAMSREEAPSHETLDEQFCVICLERERTHALIPCGHRCLCAQCCERLEAAASANCPLCTAPVMQGLRIYG